MRKGGRAERGENLGGVKNTTESYNRDGEAKYIEKVAGQKWIEGG